MVGRHTILNYDSFFLEYVTFKTAYLEINKAYVVLALSVYFFIFSIHGSQKFFPPYSEDLCLFICPLVTIASRVFYSE